MSKATDNILGVYAQCTPAEHRAGMRWYRTAHNAAVFLARHHDLSVHQTSAIIAVLSPGLRWEHNIEAAERVICGFSLDGLGVRWYDGVRKAERIVNGENPHIVAKGNKVRAFWSCIESPNDTLSVCIDGHAFAICAGQRITLEDTPTMNDRHYNRLAKHYNDAAREVGIRPCQLQAITWVTWRRLHGVVKE
jgi:hypothetical protein